jgi:dolichyl-phosphate beta-glucosyltransferase
MPGSALSQVSIVIPAYNEAARLPRSLGVLEEYLRGWEGRPHEVLVMVEESTDGTLELAKETVREQVNFHVIDNGPQRGKGHAVRSGMLRAGGDILFYMDADLSVPVEEMEGFLAYFAGHPEIGVLLGSRQHPGSRIERRQGWLRQTMGKTFNRILRMLAVLPYRDTQCGFKAFRKEAAREIFSRQRIDGFAFDVEVLLLAREMGYGVAELPVRWLNSPESKVHIVGDSLKMLRDAVMVRRRIFFTEGREDRKGRKE